MSDIPTRPLQEQVRAAIDDFAVLLGSWNLGRRAISVGGSVGKGLWDARSDIDLRLFHELDLPWVDRDPERWKPYFELIETWKQRGVVVDAMWPRRIADVDAALRRWIDGDARPEPRVWTVWGYHLPTDIYNQHVISDPHGIIAGWHRLLTPYPPKLKAALLRQHMEPLRYWRSDYHYANKVARGDVVFLASLSAKLVHDLMQVLFALNETFYPGDGANLTYAERFAHTPPCLAQRIADALYPRQADTPQSCAVQYGALCDLIDDTEALVRRLAPDA